MSVDITELVIIESLPPHEMQTGKELHRVLSAPDVLPIPVSFGRVQSAESLLKIIRSMTDHAARFSWWKPIVHLEIHGDADRAGFVLASREFVPWNVVADALRELNVIVRNSVVLVLGTCSGAFVLTAVANSPFERAPLYGVIGPDRPVLSFFLPIGFRVFYTTLLATGDFVAAVNELRGRTLPEYGGYDCALVFRLGLAKYKEYSQGEHLAKRVKKVMRRLPPQAIAQAGSRNRARRAIAGHIRGTATDRREQYRHFIMADLYPENEARFPVWDAGASGLE